MKTLLRSIVAIYAGILLVGCDSLKGGKITGGHNPQTGEISGTVEIEFKDQQGNVIKRRYPRNHPAVKHLLANP